MFIIKDTLPSTSSYLAGIAADAPHGTVVMAREQTAGRGQRGNSWEAEPGCNITLSLLLRPEGLHPARQFVISQAVSIAIADLVSHFVAAQVSIKWPNDREALSLCTFAIPVSILSGTVIIWVLCAVLRALSPIYFATKAIFI